MKFWLPAENSKDIAFHIISAAHSAPPPSRINNYAATPICSAFINIADAPVIANNTPLNSTNKCNGWINNWRGENNPIANDILYRKYVILTIEQRLELKKEVFLTGCKQKCDNVWQGGKESQKCVFLVSHILWTALFLAHNFETRIGSIRSNVARLITNVLMYCTIS